MTIGTVDTTHAKPISQLSSADLALGRAELQASGLDPISLACAEAAFMRQLSPQQMAQFRGRAADAYQLGPQQGTTIDAQGNVTLGSQPSTASPHTAYSQQAFQTAGTYAVPLETVGTIRTTGKPFSGQHLANCLDQATPERRARFMEKHGIVQEKDGTYLLPVQDATGQFSAIAPGQGGNPIGQSTFNVLQKSSWLAPVLGFVGGGIPGLIGGAVMARSLKSVSGGMTAPGLMHIGSGATPGGYVGDIAGVGGYGGLAAGAQMLGLDGMAFSLRKQMRSYCEDFKDQSMIGMIHNPGIPIEDLIFLFMAYMGDKYEQKLRDKMEEAAIAEKREREREREQDKARMLGGIASLVPGVGPLIGSAIEMGVNEKLRIKDALNGSAKSSTVLMQEVQMLMHKWKQMNEMLSNLMKAMHDMAMTPIRNMR